MPELTAKKLCVPVIYYSTHNIATCQSYGSANHQRFCSDANHWFGEG